VFVGGIRDVTEESDLMDYFSQFGTVSSADIAMDKTTGRKRGFAFITFDDYDSVDKCVCKLTCAFCISFDKFVHKSTCDFCICFDKFVYKLICISYIDKFVHKLTCTLCESVDKCVCKLTCALCESVD